MESLYPEEERKGFKRPIYVLRKSLDVLPAAGQSATAAMEALGIQTSQSTPAVTETVQASDWGIGIVDTEEKYKKKKITSLFYWILLLKEGVLIFIHWPGNRKSCAYFTAYKPASSSYLYTYTEGFVIVDAILMLEAINA